MAFNAGTIAAQFKLDTKSVTKSMKGISEQIRNAFGGNAQRNMGNVSDGLRNIENGAKNATRHLKDVERIIGGIAVSQGFYRMAGQIEQAAQSLFTFMGDMEKAQIAFETFLGSEDRAKGFIYTMKDFAAETSFATDQALHLSKQLMAAQFDPAEVRNIMEILNDASSVSGASPEVIDRVVYAMNQMKTKGKVMAEEMRQLANANIPIYRIMSEQLGIAKEEIMDIGDLNIDGDLGVRALLRGLEQEYKGTAKRIARTVPGLIANIKDNLLFLGEGLFQGPYAGLRDVLSKFQDTLDEMRELMANGGFGAVFEKLFPPSVANDIRTALDSVRAIGKGFIDLAKALQPVAAVIGSGVAKAFATLGPIIAVHVQYLAKFINAAIEAVPPLKYLAAAIVSLTVGFAAGRALMFLWRITGMGLIAATVAKAVTLLGTAINYLTMALTKNKITAAIMIIATALLGIALSSKVVVKWLDNVMAKINQLAGINGKDVLKPEDMDLEKLAAEFNKGATGADNLNEAIEESGEKAEEAGKKFKKYILSFDEVFQVPDQEDDDDDDKGPKVPDFKVPDLTAEIEDSLPDSLELPPFEMPDLPEIIFGKNLDKFRWPEFPKWTWPQFEFAWPALPVWTWPAIPAFDWPALPKWEWPPLPQWEVPPLPIPEWVLKPIPVPQLGPVLDPVIAWLKEWAADLQLQWEGAWNPLRSPVNIPIPGIGPALEGVLKELQEWGKQVQEKWGDAWRPSPQPLINVLPQVQTAWENLKGVFTGGLGLVAVGASEGFKTLGTTISNFASSGWQSLKQMGTDMVTNWNTSMGQLKSAWSDFSEWFSSGWSTALTAAGEFFADLGSAIWEGLQLAWQSVKDGLSAVGEWMGEHWKEIVAGLALVIIGAIALFFAPISGAVAGAAGTITVGVQAAIAGIGAALLAIGALWDDGREAVIKWGKDTYETVSTWATDTWTKFSDWSKDTYETVSTWASDTWTSFTNWTKDVGTDIGKWATDTGSKISTWASSTAESVGKWAGDVKGWLSDVWSTGTEKVGSLADTAISKFKSWTEDASTKVSTFKDNFGNWMGELPGKMTAGIQSIPSLFTGIMNKLPAPVKTALDNGLKFFKNLPGNMKTAITNLPTRFKEVLDELPKKVPSVITTIVKAFADLPNKIWNAIKSIPSKIAEVFGNIKLPSFSSVGDGVKATFSKIGNIAGFADGGIIDKDSIVRVGEGGRREAIVPLDNYTAMQPFADAVAQRIGNVQPAQQQTSQSVDTLRPLYVGTLIADERGLKELYRKMEVIELGEQRRGGRPN